jgi:hypothetical protein
LLHETEATMMFAWPPGAKFFDGLVEFDERALEQARRGGCPHCGRRLDRADFPRKARGVPPVWEAAFSRRLSLCCSRDGCRKRLTPPSARFLGRRIYVAFVVLIGGLSAWSRATIARRTLVRWQAWWRRCFVETGFFRTARARFMPPLDEGALPASLIERFVGASGFEAALLATLAFVSPLTTESARSSFSRDGP